jgi:hypothetical protein
VTGARAAEADEDSPFTVWPKTAASEVDAYSIRACSAKHAAEKRARADWTNEGQASWPVTYCVRDGESGTIWEIDVAIASQPTFVAYEAREIEMPAATHILWGGHALCGDLRLRCVPRDWPAGHRFMSLKAIADGETAPPDRCAGCWEKAPTLVDELRQIGRW